MATITTRAGKGSPLTNTEVDDNFSNLNSAKYESGSTVTFESGNFYKSQNTLTNVTIHNPLANTGGSQGASLSLISGKHGSPYTFWTRLAQEADARLVIRKESVGEILAIEQGGNFVYNEDSYDIDFRVESNDNANMLFVDAGNNRVGIGIAPSKTLDVNGTVLFRTGGSTPAATVANYSSGLEIIGGNMRLNIDVSDASNGGSYIQTRHKASAYPAAYYKLNLNPLGGPVIINEEGSDNSGFRAESDSNSNAFVLDAVSGNIGMGGASNVPLNVFRDGAGNTELLRLTNNNTNNHNFYVFVNDDDNMVRFGSTGDNGGNFAFMEATNTNDSIVLYTAGGAVFNELGNDSDFRVESSNVSNMFVVDAGTDQVLIGQTHLSDEVPSLQMGTSRFLAFHNGLGTHGVYNSAMGFSATVDTSSSPTQMVLPAGRNTHGGSVIFSDYEGRLHFSTLDTADTAAATGGLYANQRLALSDTDVIFNDSSNDTDFRIESDGSSNAIFVDAGNNRVGILTNSPPLPLSQGERTGAALNYINGTANTISTNTGVFVSATTTNESTVSYGLQLANNSNAADTRSPMIGFSALSASEGYNHTYAGIWGLKSGNGADTNWNTGQLHFGTSSGTGVNVRMKLSQVGGLVLTPHDNGHAVFNEESRNADFRIESDTNANALFVDASENTVVFGNNAVNLASGYSDQTGMGVHANDGYVQIAANSTPLTLGRTTTAGRGAHIVLRNASSVVGEIGDFNGVPYIGYTGGAGGGLMFNGTAIEPTGIAGARQGNINDIGSGNFRWRNGLFSNTVQARSFERMWNFLDLQGLDMGYFYPVSLDNGSASVLQSFELFKYYGNYNPSVGGVVQHGACTMKLEIAGYSWGGNVIHNYLHHVGSTYRCMVGAVTLRGYYVPVIWLRGGYGYHWTSNNPNITATIHTSNTSFYSSPYNYTIGRITDSVMQGKTGYLGTAHKYGIVAEDTGCNNWYT